MTSSLFSINTNLTSRRYIIHKTSRERKNNAEENTCVASEKIITTEETLADAKHIFASLLRHHIIIILRQKSPLCLITYFGKRLSQRTL